MLNPVSEALTRLMDLVHELRVEGNNPAIRSALADAREALALKPQPAAWLWRYIGPNPLSFHSKPIARSVEEMDPDNNPYPDHWEPIKPLYTLSE